MAGDDKDIIYVDIDDEITAVIDKVEVAGKKIVALVLPKRATVFQSIVNMKLLKRSAEEAGKNVVLITSESNLLPLAGAVGMHVAKTLQTKPEIPQAPDANEPVEPPEEAAELDNTTPGDFDPDKEATQPVGELATRAAAESPATVAGVETLELDNEPEPAAAAPAAAQPPVKAKKDKKLRVPNFTRFRKRLILAGLIIILLIAALIFALKVLPRARINVKTNAQAINSAQTITLDTKADSLDPAQKIVPAKTEQEQKTATQTAQASGQQNKGNKASGSVTMTEPCSPTPPSSVPAGTGVSSGGLTYITQSTVSFTPTLNGGSCVYSGSSDIAAQNPGANYNTGSTSFNVNSRSNLNAQGSASGGSDNIVKVVQQSDINTARQKLETQDAGAVQKELVGRLKSDGLFAITATFSTGHPSVTTSANAGDTANNVTVTETITYVMYGARENDLKKLIDNDVKTQIDPAKQSVLDEGLDGATFKVVSPGGSSEQVSLDATATAGPHLDTASLKQQVAGKKSGDIQSIIKDNPGVTGVDVHFSPFWVSTAPKNPDKISIKFAKPKAASSND